jgi:hypothetical protein
MANIGVTPKSGAVTPAYNPFGPFFAMIFFTTSMAPLYFPFSAVCKCTFTKSKGWPVNTAHTPPTPPAARARREWTREDVASTAASLTSSFASEAEGTFFSNSCTFSFIFSVVDVMAEAEAGGDPVVVRSGIKRV